MRLGITLPLTDIQGDPAMVRDFAQAAEGLGYHHLGAPDHVLGVNVASRPDWGARNTSKDCFHDPFVLFGFLSACTRTIEVSTQVMILPQRQTALVAKQAAEVDVLSGGRLRLGIGIGWNHVEYEALGENFQNRGRRSEEQIAVLRALWTQEVVSFEGRWHRITHAGLNPLPIQRPIPIWLGAGGRLNPIPPEPVMRRIARLADGWFPMFPPNDAGQAAIARVQSYAREAGRDPSVIGMEARINLADGLPEVWAQQAQAWKGLGATHLSVNTMRAELRSPDAHIKAIRQFKEAVGG
jgi:probable F420-dependent oxidoreductase